MKPYLLVCIIFCTFRLPAQFYDAKWTIGDLPQTLLDFTSDSLTLDSTHNPYSFFLTNASICDENGEFLYSTNGVYIFDKNGDTLQNGTGINPSSYTEQYICCGLNILQAALFIPQPGSNRYYYLFHFTNDDTINGGPKTFYYSLIDRQGNGGLGAVIEKNVPLMQNTLLREGGMTACKHANGRDYWLTVGGSSVNRFYKFLVTPNGVSGPYIQSIGPEFPLPFDNAYSRFSQDGSKFVTGVYEGPVLVMDFDRCNGVFGNPVTIFNEACKNSPPCSGSSSVEFSPNNRFVYVADVITLTQYDLWSNNIQDSSEIYNVDSSQYAQLFMLQLAPNGKIYLSTWAGLLTTDSIHVINNPNAKGDSCNFRYASQPTYTHNALAVPNLINYKLGPLLNSGCDTLNTTGIAAITLQTPLRIIPNPANKYAYVEMGAHGNYQFDLLNPTGQVIDKKQTPQVDIFDTEYLAPGVYLIRVTNKTTGAEIATKKLVVVH